MKSPQAHKTTKPFPCNEFAQEMDQTTDITQQGHLKETIKYKTDVLLHSCILEIKIKFKMF